MKILRACVIGFIGLWTFAVCALLGTKIGYSLSDDPLSAIATALGGLIIGSLVGVIAAIVVAKYFVDHVWPGALPWKEILGFYAVVLAASIGYLGLRISLLSQNKIPMQATQTAGARLTQSAIGNIDQTLSTLTKTAISATPIVGPTDTLYPTQTP